MKSVNQLKADPCTVDIPVIFLTVKSEVDDEIRGFQLGAVDYITKPMSPPLVLSRVKTHLALSQTRRILKNQNQLLEERVRERTHEISRTQDVAIFCLASLARDAGQRNRKPYSAYPALHTVAGQPSQSLSALPENPE